MAEQTLKLFMKNTMKGTNNMYEVYTDGSCRANKTGGYGFIVVHNNEIVERYVYKEENTTNQRMELKALLEAYRYCKDNNITHGKILSDSAYCLNCAFQKWYVKWEKNNYISTKGNEVKNKDLWEELIPFFKEGIIELVKVEGHSNNYYNNFIDSLVTTISSPRTEDLQGQQFGLLTVIRLYGNKFTEGQDSTFWKCKCKCGEEKVVSHNNLKSGSVCSCGKCLSERYEDLSN